jgi:hypothetical protein
MTAPKFIYDDGGRAAAGFRGSAGDCVTRAIAIAGQLDYRTVYDELAAGEARTKRGKRSARNGVSKRVYRKWFTDHGWLWTPTMHIGSGCTTHLDPDELPSGRLVAACSKHLVAVIDGVVHDTGDPSRDGTRCVYGYAQPPDTTSTRARLDQLAAVLAPDLA